MGGKGSKGSSKHEGALRATRHALANGAFGQQFKSASLRIDVDELLTGPRAKSLVRALKKGDKAAFLNLIRTGDFGLNECLDAQRMTPLHLAAVTGSAPILRALLLFPNLDLNLGNRDGDTALMLLLKASTTEFMTSALLTALAQDPRTKVEVTNGLGATALSIAVGKGYRGAVEVLANEQNVQKYSLPSLGMTIKLALMFNQEHLIEPIFGNMGKARKAEFMDYFKKEGPEFAELSKVLQDSESDNWDDAQIIGTVRQKLTVPNHQPMAPRCTMPGTPEFFAEQRTEDAKGHALFVGNLVRIMSEEVVRKVNPRIDGEDDDFIEAVADQEAYIHDIDDDGDMYVDTTDTPYSGYINSKSVIYVSQGPREEIRDGTKVGVGYLVKVIGDEEEVKALSKGHGGWKSEWNVCSERTGRVCKIDKAGDVFVYFPWGARVCFNPMALVVSCSEEIETKDYDGNWIKRGSNARVTEDAGDFEFLQEEIGVACDEKYKEVMGKQVTVHRLRVFLQYTDAVCHHGTISFKLNPRALRLITPARDTNGNELRVGDLVTVLNEVSQVKRLQTANFGNWSEKMADVVGSSGVVMSVEVNPGTRESVAKVQFPEGAFYLNPKALRTSSDRNRLSQNRDTGYGTQERRPSPAGSARGISGSFSSSRPSPDPNEGLQIISRDELSIKRKIGEGGFGTVTLGSWRGTDCAIKQIRSVVTSGLEYSDLLKEAKIQFSLKHPNIVQLYGISYKEDLWMVMQFINGLDLFDLLFGNDGTKNVVPASARRIASALKIKIAVQTTNAISYLHDKGYLHNDMKPENIIIEHRTGNIFVCDFGITQYLGTINIQTLSAKYTTSFGGTLPYIAPECFVKDPITKKYLRPTFKSDVWAIGAIFAELFLQKELFPDEKTIYTCKIMKDFSDVKKFAKGLPVNVRPILTEALNSVQDKRPTCRQMNSFFYELSKSVRSSN